MKFKPSVLFLTLFCLITWISVPRESLSQLRGSSEIVAVGSFLSTDIVLPGSSFNVAVVLSIDDNWHINAHRPTLEYLIGTDLIMESHDDFIISDIHYPKPEEYEFDFAGGEKLLVYSGRVPIYLDIRTSTGLQPGDYALKGEVRVQACDDQNCLAPSMLPVTIQLEIGKQGDHVQSVNENVFKRYEDSKNSDDTFRQSNPNEIETMFRDRGVIFAFLALFFIGLALNLTPCVYPMLSVTVSIFGGQNDTNIYRVFSKAVIYVLGIATMYSLLGVLASFSGELFGSWLQQPWVLGGIGILLFALALSMFGLYEIQLPYWLRSRLGTGNSTGYTGTYLSGLVVGIFAAPCIGPPIIALLAFIGAQGDPVFGFWSFFVLSLGLGLPYLILGTFSGLLSKLPKSGMWMIWVKKTFGVVLIALALFYLAMPFFTVNEAYWVIPISMIAGGIYLGFMESSGRGSPVFSKIKMAFGAFAIIAGVLFIINLQKEGMSWENFDEFRLEEAQRNGDSVVLDFYADWCIPCLELDRITFTDNRVIDATEDMIKLKVDLTHFDSPDSEALRRAYNVAGVPTLIFLDGSGNEITNARVVGFVGPDEFLRRIQNVEE